MSSTFAPTNPIPTGRGKMQSAIREHRAALRRIRVSGYGVTSGPLGTWVAFTPRQKASSGGGRDTWAA